MFCSLRFITSNSKFGYIKFKFEQIFQLIAGEMGKSYECINIKSIQYQYCIYIILNINVIDRTAHFYQSNCPFSAVNHWIKAKVEKKKTLRESSLALINSTICQSSTKHLSCLCQPTFNHGPPNGFSSRSPVGAKKMNPDNDHMVQPLLSGTFDQQQRKWLQGTQQH